MVTVHKITVKGRNQSRISTPFPSVTNFWELVEQHEGPLKAREDLVDWDRDSCLSEFSFKDGTKILFEYL